MSHEIAEIIVPPMDHSEIPTAIAQIMKQFNTFQEEDEDSYRAAHGWHDYYVIGGRYDGAKIEAGISPKKLDLFYKELSKMEVKVSSFIFGKQELVGRTAEVDALWREWFPNTTEKCLLFAHSGDQHANNLDNSICRVDEIPASLMASRVILSRPHYSDKSRLEAKDMLVKEYFNGCRYQNTAWNGNVLDAIKDFREYSRAYNRNELEDDWLVVTVDYHN